MIVKSPGWLAFQIMGVAFSMATFVSVTMMHEEVTSIPLKIAMITGAACGVALCSWGLYGTLKSIMEDDE